MWINSKGMHKFIKMKGKKINDLEIQVMSTPFFLALVGKLPKSTQTFLKKEM